MPSSPNHADESQPKTRAVLTAQKGFNTMRRELTGSIMIVAAMAIFGIFGVLVRSISASPLMLIAMPAVATAIALMGNFTSYPRRAYVLRQWPLIVAVTVACILTEYTYFMAFRRTTFANAVAVHYIAPILVAVFAPLLLKERLMQRTKWMLVLGTLGVLAIAYPHKFSLTDQHTTGILLAAVSSVTYAALMMIYNHLGKNLGVPAPVANFLRYSMTAVVLLPLLHAEVAALDAKTALQLLGFGILFGLVASSLLHNTALGMVRSQIGAILGYTELISATIYGALLQNEPLTIYAVIGGALIVISGARIIFGKQKETKQEQVPRFDDNAPKSA